MKCNQELFMGIGMNSFVWILGIVLLADLLLLGIWLWKKVIEK